MNDLSVILRTHELYKSISTITEKLPAGKCQTLGRHTENAVLKLLEVLVMTKSAQFADYMSHAICAPL